MIKLIASDLDGTLLQGTGEISEEVVMQIKKLSQMGILFVAASGRQYPNLRRLFEPVKDEIAYICENGALVVYKDQVLHKDVFNKDLEEELLNSNLLRNRTVWIAGISDTLSLSLQTSYLNIRLQNSLISHNPDNLIYDATLIDRL